MNALTRHTGFTLVEFLMTMILFSIVAAMAAKPVLQGFVAYTTAMNLMDTDWQARAALQRMTRDLHGLSAITSASANGLTFTDRSNNVVSYGLSGTQLQRTGIAVQPFAYNVSNLSFTYFDSTGATLSAPLSSANLLLVSSILISLTINENGNVSTVTVGVSPRNGA